MAAFDDVNLDRERLIYRYFRAMENNDADTTAEMLELAINDIELASVIDAVNQAYAEELEVD